jgi:hypothetical protein
MISLRKLFTLLLVFSSHTLIVLSQAPNPEIFLFSVEMKDGKPVLADGKNITNSPGYDNQPSFSLDGSRILLTSIRETKDTNIYEYSLADGKLAQIITSPDGDYSAREFDSRTVYFVREGQDQEMTVMKFDRETKRESPVLKNKEPVAYYAFNAKGDGLVWIRYAFMMHWVNPEKGINRFVADYAQPSAPQLIPNTDNFSFIKRLPNDELWIHEFNPGNQAVRPIVQPRDGKIHYCWLSDGSLLMGSGTRLFRFDEKADKAWVQVADLSSFGIKDITRLTLSPDGKKMALVSNQ